MLISRTHKALRLGKSMETQPLFWKSVFLSDLLCSIDRYAIENRFDRNYFATYTWNTGGIGRYLGTSMNDFQCDNYRTVLAQTISS